MTISSTTVKNSYSGNGTLNTFNYTFKVFANTDLQVIIRDASANETVKTLTTHYTVTGAGNANGGTIVFTSGNIPTNTETVVIRRASPQTQAIDYIANDPFPAESHEEGLDRSMMAIQQLQEEIDRSIKLSRTNTMTSTEFTVGDTDRANKVFGFDANGELTVAQELGTFKGNWSSGTTYAVRDLVKDTSTNNIFIALTAHTSSGSQPLTTNTDSAKWGLLVDAATATTSSTSAASSATAAANSASSAATSATNASASAVAADNSRALAGLSAVGAGTHATNASNSATASANSASAAEATFDLFDDAFLGAKSSNPSVDNDGNALQDGALYFDTTNDVMKVYNLASTTWLQLTPTVTNQNNINSAVANASNINAAVANESNINAAVSNASNINSVVSNASNINSVAGISTAITNVNNNSSNINAVNSNSANINLTAGSIANVNNVGGSIASVNTAASNLTSINSFANTYLGASSSAPTQDPDGSSLDLGDLYFDTGSNQLKVYSSTGWVNAGSSVNGTSDRFKYTVSGTPTTISGNDDNSNSLSYDAGFIDVFLNGIKMVNGTDVTVTSGNSVVFASALTNGDVVDIITFGTFNIATLGNTSVTGGLSFPDNVKAKFGTGNDLEIYHDGANSFVSEVGSGNLFVNTNGTKIALISDLSSSNGKMAEFTKDGKVELYYDNTKKIETTASGVAVGGDVQVDNGASLGFGGSNYKIEGSSSANHRIAFHTDGSERARFDASGNLLVGKTDQTANVSGTEIEGSGTIVSTRDNNTNMFLNRKTSDGQIINFRKDNSVVGSIGTASGKLNLGTENCQIRFRDDLTALTPANSDGSNSDNDIDLGYSTVRWRRLYLSEGVFLGGTGTANRLDDYEEGLHTASITDSGGTATITMNSSFNQLSYTKIGRLVHVQGTLLVASISANISGTVRISLPFTASSLADQAGKGRIGIGTHNVNFTSSGTAPFLHVGENDAYGQIIVTNDNLNASQAQFGDTSAQFYIGGTYITDA